MVHAYGYRCYDDIIYLFIQFIHLLFLTDEMIDNWFHRNTVEYLYLAWRFAASTSLLEINSNELDI